MRHSPSPIDDMLSQNVEAANPELPQILYNLRHMEAQLKGMDITSHQADCPLYVWSDVYLIWRFTKRKDYGTT